MSSAGKEDNMEQVQQRREMMMYAAHVLYALAAGGSMYTVEDILALPEGKRAELLDGEMFMMATPTWTHQRILGWLYLEIATHIRARNGKCQVGLAPFAVFLKNDRRNYVEPDIGVICDKNKIDDKGVHGAPDWIIEIVSPSSIGMDYHRKLAAYRSAGVREYWIVDYLAGKITVYDFGAETVLPQETCLGQEPSLRQKPTLGQDIRQENEQGTKQENEQGTKQENEQSTRQEIEQNTRQEIGQDTKQENEQSTRRETEQDTKQKPAPIKSQTRYCFEDSIPSLTVENLVLDFKALQEFLA